MSEQEKKWRKEFEEFYSTSAFNYEENPIGSRECGLQWASYLAAKRQDAERIAELERANKVHDDYIAMAKNTEYFLRQQQIDSNKDWSNLLKTTEQQLSVAKEETAELRAKLKVATKEILAYHESRLELLHRAEAAEAKLEALEKQEPVFKPLTSMGQIKVGGDSKMIGQEKFYAWWNPLLTDSPVHRVSEVDAQVIWQAARAEVDMLKAQIAEYDGLMEDAQVFQAEIARLHKSITSLQNLNMQLSGRVDELNHQHKNDEAANQMLSDVCAQQNAAILALKTFDGIDAAMVKRLSVQTTLNLWPGWVDEGRGLLNLIAFTKVAAAIGREHTIRECAALFSGGTRNREIYVNDVEETILALLEK